MMKLIPVEITMRIVKVLFAKTLNIKYILVLTQCQESGEKSQRLQAQHPKV